MKRVRVLRLSRLAAASLLAMATSGCDEISTTRVLAQVMESKGDVYLCEGPSRIPLATNSALSAGKEVETGPDATALIALLPGMVVQMDGNTLIKIDKLRFVKNGNATAFSMRLRQARIELKRGSVQAVMPVTFVRGEMEIVTPAGVLTAPETSISYVSCREDAVRAVATRGGINFRSTAGATMTLPPGNYIEWPIQPGKSALEPARLEDDPGASEQAKEGLEAERHVVELMPERWQMRPPP